MSYSNGFKINVNKLNADEALLVLVKITHPYVSQPICLVNDSNDLVVGDETFLAMPFSLKKQNDIQGELPKANLIMANSGKSLIKWIDASGGGRKAKIEVLLTRRSNTIIEESIIFGISNVTIDSQRVSFSLIVQNNLIKRSIRWVYDLFHSPGIF